MRVLRINLSTSHSTSKQLIKKSSGFLEGIMLLQDIKYTHTYINIHAYHMYVCVCVHTYTNTYTHI